MDGGAGAVVSPSWPLNLSAQSLGLTGPVHAHSAPLAGTETRRVPHTRTCSCSPAAAAPAGGVARQRWPSPAPGKSARAVPGLGSSTPSESYSGNCRSTHPSERRLSTYSWEAQHQLQTRFESKPFSELLIWRCLQSQHISHLKKVSHVYPSVLIKTLFVLVWI